MKKKIIFLIATVVCLIIAGICFCACDNEKVKVNYMTDGNGTIQGEAEQEIKAGEETSEVTVVANKGYKFIKWSDENTQATRADVVGENITFTAIFEKCVYSVTYSVGNGGSIQGDKNQTVEYGSSSTSVTAISNEGYKFVKWSDESTQATRSDIVTDSDLQFTALFEKCKYTVSYLVSGGGKIEGDRNQAVEYGSSSTSVTAIPNEGYKFVKWSDENTQATRADVVEENTAITAIFEKCMFRVQYTATQGGEIEGETNQTVEYGGSAKQVIAKPSKGYSFLKWLDNNSINPIRNDIDVKKDINTVAYFQKRNDVLVITYETDGNGTIEGKTTQYIFYDDDTVKVTAIPNDGYEFLKWSDGVATAERQDLRVQESKTITAQFKRVYVRYKLDYRLGETDSDITEYKFYDDDFKTVKFPIPTREHFTFGGWYIGDRQVTDTNGGMLIGEELLQSEEKEIYAKWTANENYTYKILMVYVTELDATIPSIKGNGDFDVYYKMTDFDIEICKTITKQMRYYLNDMLDGLVTFEIDEYFTAAPVGTESISNGSVGNFIDAIDIPEIYNSDIYKKYQSILTVFNMDDYDYEFRSSAGSAYIKYGTVYLESVYGETKLNGEPLGNILDVNFWRWVNIIEPFLHELAHTIDLQMVDRDEDYHKAMSWFSKQGIVDNIIRNKIYYQNMIIADGKKIGIPFEFWSGEMELTPSIKDILYS